MRAKRFRTTAAVLLALSLGALRAGAQNPTSPSSGVPVDTAAPSYASGAQRGDSSAALRTEFHWFGRGFLAGALTGPIGTWWAVSRAGRSNAEPARAVAEPASADPVYQQGYQQGYSRRLRSERREYAFMGGALGTAVFTYALIRIAKLQDHANSNGDPGGGGPQLVRIPIPLPSFDR